MTTGAAMNEPKALRVDPIATPASNAAAGVLLVGTGETLAELRAQFQSAGFDAASIRCVVPEELDDVDLAGVRRAVVCIPDSRGGTRERVLERLRRSGITARCAAPAADLLAPTGGAGVADAQWRATPTIDLAELIGRRPHALDRAAIAGVLAGKRVLITGAGGSIGSHLAMVAAEFAPESIILVERAENALFEIDRQLGRRFPAVSRRAVLHDVVDADQTARLLAGVSPQVVFHAAAHKHVPLMEDHPAHAVANNLFGTKSIADAAAACGAERFVMISSDKAVNPSSVMGATKRLAELYVRWLGASQDRTRMSMVRFGNVLGSACSVLTIWSTQIAEGGPLSVTDPRMTRYFMTIPEAAALVIASTTLDGHASGGVYVLDMGKPIRILDLARRFVMAHGMRPRLRYSTLPEGTMTIPLDLDGDEPSSSAAPTMDIEFTGARPGEKLHEELAYAAENLAPTGHPGIRAWSGLARTTDGGEHSDAVRLSRAAIDRMVRELRQACAVRNPAQVVEAIQRHVPEMARRTRASAA
jgi:FlaA1/EpsC-like NDP-sugar epimerase